VIQGGSAARTKLGDAQTSMGIGRYRAPSLAGSVLNHPSENKSIIINDIRNKDNGAFRQTFFRLVWDKQSKILQPRTLMVSTPTPPGFSRQDGSGTGTLGTTAGRPLAQLLNTSI
jgi:hypothetical protein